MNKKVGIIGLGWIGVPLANQFIKKGFAVIGTGRSQDPKQGIHPDVTYQPLNIDAIVQIPDSIKNVDSLIITIPPSATNFVEGIKKIITQINDAKIYFLSSTGVYGKQPGNINEQDSKKPDRSSTRKISEVEDFILNQSSHSFSIFRLGGLVGPGRNPGYFFSNKRTISSPDTPINLVHQRDVIRAITFVHHQNDKPKIVNVVTPYHPTKGDFYTKMSKIFDQPSPQLGDKDAVNRIIESRTLDRLGFTFQEVDLLQKNIYL